MNGGSRRTAAVILGLCLLTGCGTKENEAQYVQPQGLEALQVFLIAPAAAAPEEETVLPAEEPEPEQPRLPKEAEVTGAEEETLRTLIRAAEVYNSPSVEGTQIGSLKRGERVAAIGPAESAEWIKIEYNGRVAYVETEVLKGQAGNTEGQSAVPGQNTGGGLNVAPTPTPTPEPTPTPTPTPPEQTATPTPTPPEQTPSPTPTGEQIHTDTTPKRHTNPTRTDLKPHTGGETTRRPRRETPTTPHTARRKPHSEQIQHQHPTAGADSTPRTRADHNTRGEIKRHPHRRSRLQHRRPHHPRNPHRFRSLLRSSPYRR